jgi:hypothetical protein
VDPERAQLLVVDDGLNGLADALDGAVVDVESIEDDLEGGDFRALSQGVIQIFHKVPEHAFFVSGKVAVSAALKR